MTVPLDGGDEPITIGERVRLRAPGLTGAVDVRSAFDAVAAPDPAGSADGRGAAPATWGGPWATRT